MKNKILILIIFISVNIFSQEKPKLLEDEFAPFTLLCKKIGDSMINNTTFYNMAEWYEGTEPEKIISYLEQLKSDISESKIDVTYDIILMRDKPLFYTIHFNNPQIKDEYGQLFLVFKDRKNLLVDKVHYISKENMEKIDSEPLDAMSMRNIKLPPPLKSNSDKK